MWTAGLPAARVPPRGKVKRCVVEHIGRSHPARTLTVLRLFLLTPHPSLLWRSCFRRNNRSYLLLHGLGHLVFFPAVRKYPVTLNYPPRRVRAKQSVSSPFCRAGGLVMRAGALLSATAAAHELFREELPSDEHGGTSTAARHKRPRSPGGGKPAAGDRRDGTLKIEQQSEHAGQPRAPSTPPFEGRGRGSTLDLPAT